MDDGCGMTVKGNNDIEWNSDAVVLWLERKQNRDVWLSCEKIDQG
jgi:hypothetical protein